MSLITQYLTTEVSAVTKDASVNHSSLQIKTHYANHGETLKLEEMPQSCSPLNKRIWSSVEPDNKIEKPSKYMRKQLHSTSMEESPPLLDLGQQVMTSRELLGGQVIRTQVTSKLENPCKKKQRPPKPKKERHDGLDHAEQVAILRSLPGCKLIPKPQPVSTDLVLYEWPWKIRKKLHESDLNDLSRLLLQKRDVKTHVLPYLSDKMVAQIGDKKGLAVTVWDRDTDSVHQLILKYWWSSESFLLNGNWIGFFKNRRGLRVGDEIGLYWDQCGQKFVFTVLDRSRSILCCEVIPVINKIQ